MENNSRPLSFAGKWVKISGIRGNLKKMLGEFDGNHAFGYFYIDHQEGQTLVIALTFDLKNDEMVNVKSPVKEGVHCMSRLHSFGDFDQILTASEEEIRENDLKLLIPLEKLDARKDLQQFRGVDFFDQFRAPGFPDDVKILFPPAEKRNPELVWGRVEAYDEENYRIQFELLNQPSQNFGVRKGEMLFAVPVEVEDQVFLWGELPEKPAQAPETKKKRWKFW
ncbi:MAG: hypothetical protein H6581_04415 [Bacteroidia bacterium]|nr:hypothetical protein [Bacteroidia bacterium]